MKLKVKKLGDLTRPIIQFAKDVEEAEDTLDAEDSQYKRRVLARALFAMIEGTVYFLKQTTFSTGFSIRGKLKVGEFLLLLEETTELKSNGQIYTKKRFIPIEDNLKFLARMMNEVFGAELDLGVGTAAWREFQTALAIRNRITHPKSEEEFSISDSEVETMKRVQGWFCQITADAVSGIASFVSKHPRAKAALERIQ
jgi:hypothetical protein